MECAQHKTDIPQGGYIGSVVGRPRPDQVKAKAKVPTGCRTAPGVISLALDVISNRSGTCTFLFNF